MSYKEECLYCGIDLDYCECDDEHECSSCEVSQSWFQSLREQNQPYKGCNHCETQSFMWCDVCDEPKVACDTSENICSCEASKEK